MAGISRKSWCAVTLPFMLAASAATLAQAGASGLKIEPLNGQTQQQEWSDRYACYHWAREQSGFDPTRQSGGVPSEEVATHRKQYRRALVACLEGRGYSVREAATSSAAPEPSAPSPITLPPGGDTPHSLRYDEPRSASVREFRYQPFSMQIEGGYTVTVGSAHDQLENGWNVGLGLAWQPFRALPLAFRVDGSYSRFGETQQSLNQASQTYGANINWGHQSLYGGDVDAQINLRMGPTVREYFVGGVGWYREQTVLGQVNWQQGLRCGFFCFPGWVPVSSTYSTTTSGWINSWNAGIGFEFALAPPGSFFIEARYVRLSPVSSRTGFVPIRFGLRF